MIASRGAGDLAILVYTSGTTAAERAMHSNRSVTHQMRHANDLFPSTDSEERLVFLPLCHVAERSAAITFRLLWVGDEFRRKPGNGAR